MTDCVNTYLIDRHLKEQEDREAHDMRYVDVIDVFECGGCGEMYADITVAVDCCNDDVGVAKDVYTCTACGRISENLDDIKGHDHD